MMLHSIQGISARKGETTRAFVERYDAVVRLKNGIEKLQILVDKEIQPRRFEYNDLLKQKKKGIGGIGMSEKNDKKWYKNIGIWLIVFGVALFVVNIVFACIYDENGTNIFTAISGWVSGIATIILGVIAIVQNRKYKRENDRFLKEQQQLNWKLEQKDLIKSYLCKIENIFSNVKEYQYSKLINILTLDLQNGVMPLDDWVYDEILYQINDDIMYASVNSVYYFDGIEELLDLCGDYTFKLRLLLKRLPEMIKNGEVSPVDEIKNTYRDLCQAFNGHIAHVRLFIDMIMTSWNYGDFDDYEDIEQTLREKRNKQKDWRKRIKTAHEEMIKKWKN